MGQLLPNTAGLNLPLQTIDFIEPNTMKNVCGVPRGLEPVSLHRQFFKIETAKILENCSAFFLEEATQSHASSKWYN